MQNAGYWLTFENLNWEKELLNEFKKIDFVDFLTEKVLVKTGKVYNFLATIHNVNTISNIKQNSSAI